MEFYYHRSTSGLSDQQAKLAVAANFNHISEQLLHQSNILECGNRYRPVDETTAMRVTAAIV